MKFYGLVGFFVGEEEVSPGVWKPKVEERPYTGDITRNYRKFQEREQQNDDIRLNNQISILADLYAKQNWDSIKYVLWNEVKWKVSTVEINYPRLVLEIGGVYNDVSEKQRGAS